MANTVYENKVIEAKAKELLTTAVNTRSLMTVDNSLTETEGMTKTINVYTYTGRAEKLEDGAKNGTRGSISFEGKDYKVQRVQQVFDYSDSDFMKDNNVVDMALKGANEVMANELTADFYTECAKATVSHSVATLGYEGVVDAIAKLRVEDETKFYLVIPTEWKAELRKDDDYKHAQMGSVIYNGQVGTVNGIPVIATNALTDEAYVMTNEAVKLLMKQDVEVEQDRDVESKINTVVLTTYYICALVDNGKICKIVKG
jgi:hypothetical protein